MWISFQLDVAERVIREQEAQEEQLLSRITSTELTLEETNSLLCSLQGESKILMSQIEEFYQGIVQKYEAEKQSIIHELTQKVISFSFLSRLQINYSIFNASASCY